MAAETSAVRTASSIEKGTGKHTKGSGIKRVDRRKLLVDL